MECASFGRHADELRSERRRHGDRFGHDGDDYRAHRRYRVHVQRHGEQLSGHRKRRANRRNHWHAGHGGQPDSNLRGYDFGEPVVECASFGWHADELHCYGRWHGERFGHDGDDHRADRRHRVHVQRVGEQRGGHRYRCANRRDHGRAWCGAKSHGHLYRHDLRVGGLGRAHDGRDGDRLRRDRFECGRLADHRLGDFSHRDRIERGHELYVFGDRVQCGRFECSPDGERDDVATARRGAQSFRLRRQHVPGLAELGCAVGRQPGDVHLFGYRIGRGRFADRGLGDLGHRDRTGRGHELHVHGEGDEQRRYRTGGRCHREDPGSESGSGAKSHGYRHGRNGRVAGLGCARNGRDGDGLFGHCFGCVLHADRRLGDRRDGHRVDGEHQVHVLGDCVQ